MLALDGNGRREVADPHQPLNITLPRPVIDRIYLPSDFFASIRAHASPATPKNSADTFFGTSTRLRSQALIADRLDPIALLSLCAQLFLQFAFSIAARYFPTSRLSLQLKRLAFCFALHTSLHQFISLRACF